MKNKTKKNGVKKRIVVLYHKNCSDGFGAAFAAWKKFRDRAEYIPVEPETLPNEPIRGKTVFVVDTSFPYETLLKLGRENKSVIVLDHHASNEEDTRRFPQNVFDNSHSGSVLAWRYFHPGEKMPKLLLHIEDIDLWRWKLPRTREIISALSLLDFSFKEWLSFVRELETKEGARKITARGAVVNAYEKRLIERLTMHPTLVVFEGFRTYAVNSPVLNSEVAHELMGKLPPISIVWKEREGNITVSLRSNGTVDVSKLAMKYGGGGHKRASGFMLKPKDAIPWRRIKEN